MNTERTHIRLSALISHRRFATAASLACILLLPAAMSRADSRSAYRFTDKSADVSASGIAGKQTRSAYRYSTKPSSSAWHDLGSVSASQNRSAYRFVDKAVPRDSGHTATMGSGVVSQGPFGSNTFTGWQPVGMNAMAMMAPNGAPENVIFTPSISIGLSTTSVHYTHIVGAVDLHSDLRCTLTGPGPLAFFLDDHEGTVDIHKLPWVSTWKGEPVAFEDEGNEFIATDWAVKSITGPEFADYTSGRYGTMAEGKGVQGLYWVFDRSLPGTAIFNLRNSIHTTITTPPGQYAQVFHVATGPVL